MLYSIMGSQGSGKTTAVAGLERFGARTIQRKTSRSILTDWNVSLSEVNNNRELTIKFQDEILKRKLFDEAEAVNNPELIFFTERSFVDLFVYALVSVGKDNEYSNWIDEYYQKCAEAQNNYQKVFYITAGHFNPVYDGVRGANIHYSKMVDLTMYYYANLLSKDANLIKITDPNLDNRISTIINNL